MRILEIQLVRHGKLRLALSTLYIISILSILSLNGTAISQGNPQTIGLSDRGYLTSAEDLVFISQQARWGIEPYASTVEEFLEQAGLPDNWEHGKVGGEFLSDDGDCVSDDFPKGDRFINQQGGGHEVYQKMIAYHLTHDVTYAEVAHEKLLDVTTTYGFGGEVYNGGNECILHLAFAVPLWIQAADLLEGDPIWSATDKLRFQTWLADEVYRKVAWASRVRRNNWGSAGSLAASMIADYLQDLDIVLVEVEPEYRELTPEQAYTEHNDMQLKRMNTDWKGDSECEIWGIQPDGGIPDELRRGDTGCEGQWLDDNDKSYVYQITQIDHLVFHAEFLRRRGDLSIYNNIGPDGSGSLLNAILFVFDNPLNSDHSYDWEKYKIGVLFVAYQYYQNDALYDGIYTNSVGRGGMIAYAQLTHPILPN